MTGAGSRPPRCVRRRSSTSSRHSSSSTSSSTGAPGGPAKRWSWSSGTSHRPQPPAGRLVQLIGQRGVVAARAARGSRRPSHPARHGAAAARAASVVNSSPLLMARAYPVRCGRHHDGVVVRSLVRIEVEQVVGLVVGAQHPAILGRLVLPLGQPGVRRTEVGAGGGIGDAEQQPHRRHDHAGVAHGHHRLAGVVAGQPVERPGAPARGSCSSCPRPGRTAGRARPPCRTSRSGRCTPTSPCRRPRRCGPRRGRSPGRRSPGRDRCDDASPSRWLGAGRSPGARRRAPDRRRRGGRAGLRPAAAEGRQTRQPVGPAMGRGSRRARHRGGRGSVAWPATVTMPSHH